MKTAEDYLDLPYHIVLVADRDHEGNPGWFVRVDELDGCMSQGDTPDDAIASVRDAMLGWIDVMLQDGKQIPLPREEPDVSGRILARLPRSLHAALLREAEREGTSLNQLVVGALAGAIGWRAPQPPAEATTAEVLAEA